MFPEEKKNSNEKTEKLDPEIKEEEIIMQYRDLPPDLNSVALKTRFSTQKILELMVNGKEEDLTWEDLNDPKKSGINKEKLDRKIIQFYCMENIEKNKFALPSEKTMNKIQQFKRWQNYEMFQKNGVKNYLNNILPDYRLVNRTKNYIKNNLNLYTRFKIKRKPETIILPNLENCNSNLKNNLKEAELLNNQSQSYLSSLDKNDYKKRLFRNKSTDDFRINSSIVSKTGSKNLIKSKIKNKDDNALINKNQNYLINILGNSEKYKKNMAIIKNFEGSEFCYNKVPVPLSVTKSIKSSPFGGCIVHSTSLFRNKSMNDLLANPSRRKVLEKLSDYKIQRNKIINNKDYFAHIGKTFITINKHLTNYDYNIF